MPKGNAPLTADNWSGATLGSAYSVQDVVVAPAPAPIVPGPQSATFVDNVGNETPNVRANKFGDVWVFGVRTDWLKMVSVDATGAFVEARYMAA